MPVSICYLILSHNDALHLARLVGSLLRDDLNCHVVVDHDMTNCGHGLASHERLTVREGTARRWGSFQLVEAISSAICWIYQTLDPPWIVVISGQDYPLRSLKDLPSRLAASGYDAHVEYWRVVNNVHGSPEDRWWHARYFYRWHRLPRLPFVAPPSLERLWRGLQYRISVVQPWIFFWTLPRGSGSYIGFRRLRPILSSAYPCHAGSTWFAVSRKATEAIIETLKTRPEIKKYYKSTLLADESFFVTILANFEGLKPHPSNLSFVRFGGKDNAHPDLLTLDDLKDALASSRDFGRKFQTHASATLIARLDDIAGR